MQWLPVYDKSMVENSKADVDGQARPLAISNISEPCILILQELFIAAIPKEASPWPETHVASMLERYYRGTMTSSGLPWCSFA